MQARPLIHIGYHKTATTWMQRALFKKVYGYQQLATHEDVFEHIVRPHGLWFDPAPMQQLISAGIAELPEGAVPVISSELLCSNPFYGGIQSDKFAERLSVIAPDARILISIRAQMRILPSIYMQYLSRGGTMPPSLFFAERPELGYFAFDARHLEYDRLVAKYQALFGAENVHILTQESLKSDKEHVLNRLAEFCGNQLYSGLSGNASKAQAVSYPEHAAPILRRINHIQKSTLNPAPVISLGRSPRGLYRVVGTALKRRPLSLLFGRSRPVSHYVRQNFAGRYTASNARLAELTGGTLDLSGYE